MHERITCLDDDEDEHESPNEDSDIEYMLHVTSERYETTNGFTSKISKHSCMQSRNPNYSL